MGNDLARDQGRRLRRSFLIAVGFAPLWGIKRAELALGLDLTRDSIYPGNPATPTGILFEPLLDGSLRHLFANTAPMLVLGTALLYGYLKAARIVLPIVYLPTCSAGTAKPSSPNNSQKGATLVQPTDKMGVPPRTLRKKLNEVAHVRVYPRTVAFSPSCRSQRPRRLRRGRLVV